MNAFVKAYPRARVSRHPKINGWVIDLVQREGARPRRVAATYASPVFADRARVGYRQHLRHGQEPCGPCKAANAAHSAAYRALKPPTVRVLKPCGTHAAYTRHLNHGEKPCGPCTAAHTAYQAGRCQGTPQERRAA